MTFRKPLWPKLGEDTVSKLFSTLFSFDKLIDCGKFPNKIDIIYYLTFF